MNTKFSYTYRDAANYKTFFECVLCGEITQEQINTIIDSCDYEYFIPRAVGLPGGMFEGDSGYDVEFDHYWCEHDFEDSFSLVSEAPTHIMTVNELTAAFTRCKGRWESALDDKINTLEVDSVLQGNPIGDKDWYYNHPDVKGFTGVYFNPNSNAGGEHMQISLPYDLILAAAQEAVEDPKSFFDILDARAYTEYVSIDHKSFKEQMEYYTKNPPDFIRENDTEAMNRLVSVAEIYRSLGLDNDELKAYKEALKHYAADANGVENIEGVAPLKLIYCHEHGKDLMDFDFWCQFEHLIGEEISFDEFSAINETFDGDPYDVDESDLETVSQFKEALRVYRESEATTGLRSDSLEDSPSPQIQRSYGIAVDGGYIVGGGFYGLTAELDAAVTKEAELLRDHFGSDVTIRFNSDRQSGGAWLVDSSEDTLGSNCSIGLGARLYNSRLRSMTTQEATALPRNEFFQLLNNPDCLCYETAIHLKNTKHCVPEDSPHILMDSEYRDFDTLEFATEYLFSHVAGLKEQQLPLDQKISAAKAKADNHEKAEGRDTLEIQPAK